MATFKLQYYLNEVKHSKSPLNMFMQDGLSLLPKIEYKLIVVSLLSFKLIFKSGYQYLFLFDIL